VIEDIALAIARTRGCDCDPDFVLLHDDGFDVARVKHDNWCALWQRIGGAA
jgi:hypothetical protein